MTLGMKGTPAGGGDMAPETTPLVPPHPAPPQQPPGQQVKIDLGPLKKKKKRLKKICIAIVSYWRI